MADGSDASTSMSSTVAINSVWVPRSSDCQDRDIEFTAFHHHIVGQICFIYRNTDSVGLGCYLAGGIDNAAVVLVSHPGCQYKQSVRQTVHFIRQKIAA